MHAVLIQNEAYLRDVFGSPLRDGTCVVDADREVGYVRRTGQLVQLLGSIG